MTSKQNRMFSVEIKNYNFEDVVEVDAPWSQTIRKFSHFTKINYSVIDKLLENKDMLLYAYAEYRYMPELNYRICIEEWMAILEVSNKTVFKNINDSEVVIKINNGYDTENQKQETNSYLPFNRKENVEQMAEKEVFRNSKVSKLEKIAEPVVEEITEETTEYAVEDEKVEETVTETISAEDAKGIKEQTKKMFGTTMMDNILKSMNDPEITKIDQAREVQDFDYPMSAYIFNIIKTSDDYKVRDFGEKKLASKVFKENHKDALDNELRELSQKRAMQDDKNKYRFKKFVVFYADDTKKLLSFETFNEWKVMKLIDGDDEYGYGFSREMTEDEEQYGIVKVLSLADAVKLVG